MAFGLVEEVVDLLAYFLARLAGKQLVALDDARVVLTETCRLTRGAERIEDAVAPRHVLGIEVPHSARRLKTDLFCHGIILKNADKVKWGAGWYRGGYLLYYVRRRRK